MSSHSLGHSFDGSFEGDECHWWLPLQELCRARLETRVIYAHDTEPTCVCVCVCARMCGLFMAGDVLGGVF